MLKLENPQYLCHLLDPGNDLGPVSLEMQHVAFPIFRVSRPCLQRKQEDIRFAYMYCRDCGWRDAYLCYHMGLAGYILCSCFLWQCCGSNLLYPLITCVV